MPLDYRFVRYPLDPNNRLTGLLRLREVDDAVDRPIVVARGVNDDLPEPPVVRTIVRFRVDLHKPGGSRVTVDDDLVVFRIVGGERLAPVRFGEAVFRVEFSEFVVAFKRGGEDAAEECVAHHDGEAAFVREDAARRRGERRVVLCGVLSDRIWV